MQIWNAFLLSVKPSHTVVCDTQVTALVTAFVEKYAWWMHDRCLRNNFILHLANLADFGLLSPKAMHYAILAYDAAGPSKPEAKTAADNDNEEDDDNNNDNKNNNDDDNDNNIKQ